MERTQGALNLVIELCSRHGLTINPRKTKAVIFTKPLVWIDRGAEVWRFHWQMMLIIWGVIFDHRIKWNKHIEQVSQKAKREIH